MATEDPSRILAPKKEVPYRVMRVQAHTMTIDVSGVHNVVLIDRATLATTATEAGTPSGSPAEAPTERQNAQNARIMVEDGTERPQEYVVERLIAHRNKRKEPCIGCGGTGTRQETTHGNQLTTFPSTSLPVTMVASGDKSKGKTRQRRLRGGHK